MGTWHLNIDGHGNHHNGRTDDANELARRFVNVLRDAGHEIRSATFTLTGQTDHLANEPVTATNEGTSFGDNQGDEKNRPESETQNREPALSSRK